MDIYEVTLRIEDENGLGPEGIKHQLLDATGDVEFGYDIDQVVRKYTTVAQVDALAEMIHAGQTDKIGVPYIEHVRAVAAGLAPFGPQLQMAGLLHDAIEDTDWTAEGLRQAGVESRVLRIVEMVTNNPGLTYEEKIADITSSRQATLLKIADNAHNSRADRAAALSEADRERLAKKYRQARLALWAVSKRSDVEQILEIVNPGLLPELASTWRLFR